MNTYDVAPKTEPRRDVKGLLLLAASVVIALSVTFPSIPITAIGGGTIAMLVFSLLAIALALSVLVASLRDVRSGAPKPWTRWLAAALSALSLVPALPYLMISVLRMAT